MCIRRFKLLMNLSDASVADIAAYLKRALKIYVFFTALSIFQAVTDVLASEMGAAIWSITVSALYLFYSASLFGMTQQPIPTLCSLHLCTSALVLVTTFSIVQMTFLLYNDPNNYFILLQLIGIAVALSTLYIHYHMGCKLRKLRQGEGEETLINSRV